ncbi:nuclear transport factor 2 family protein [Bradyrhizobium monzae]|uniref:nuclear transport factor 2 family protein n=1 Tax=Bradyrhizobium sp. Oc8 TaxID=2876780 RepID=UPI001F17656C|nr:nuclear transport factor 2 family protein [Bradyrhizobium sp. Oc8]
MGHREDMLDVIKRAYAARGDGDVKGLVAAFHPEGSFNLIGDNSALHLTGSVKGQQPLLAAFGQFIEHFAFEKREILTEVVEGNNAAIRSRLVIRYCPSGKVFSTEVLDLFRFQDGKIIELIEFADTAQVKAIIS